MRWVGVAIIGCLLAMSIVPVAHSENYNPRIERQCKKVFAAVWEIFDKRKCIEELHEAHILWDQAKRKYLVESDDPFESVPNAPEKTFFLHLKYAELGIPSSQFLLAVAYLRRTPTEIKQARYWFEQAAMMHGGHLPMAGSIKIMFDEEPGIGEMSVVEERAYYRTQEGRERLVSQYAYGLRFFELMAKDSLPWEKPTHKNWAFYDPFDFLDSVGAKKISSEHIKHKAVWQEIFLEGTSTRSPLTESETSQAQKLLKELRLKYGSLTP